MSPGSAHNSIKELQKMRKRAGHQVAAYNIVMLCSINVTESCPTACSYLRAAKPLLFALIPLAPVMLLIAAEASRSRPSAGRRLQHSWSKSKELSRIGPPPLFTSAIGEMISKCSRFAEFCRLFFDAWLVSADGQLLVTASPVIWRIRGCGTGGHDRPFP